MARPPGLKPLMSARCWWNGAASRDTRDIEGSESETLGRLDLR